MLTFRNPEDKTSCIVLNLLKTKNQRSGAAMQRGESYSTRRERMKADTTASVAVASVVWRRRMELIRRSSKLAVRTTLRTWVFKDR